MIYEIGQHKISVDELDKEKGIYRVDPQRCTG